MVMPECQKFTETEVNQHSGETLALNVPAQHTHSFVVPCSQYKLGGSKSYQQQPAYSSIYIQDSIYSSFLNKIVQNAKLYSR
jgi:hypothetical protein